MSFLSSKQPTGTMPQQLNSIGVNRSRYGDAVPIVYGTQRIPVTLLWYGAFTAVAQSQQGSGKGGGGTQITGYSYSASCVMGLCEGPITNTGILWKDKAVTDYATEGLFRALGAGGQAVWSYLTGSFPVAAVPYDHTAYFGAQNLNLGSSAALPNYGVEVLGFLTQTGTNVTLTATPAVGATSCVVSGTSPIADGTYNIRFKSNETRRATQTTVTGTSTWTWDPNWSLIRPMSGTGSTTIVVGGYDAPPASVIIDYCTDANHGCGFAYLNQTQITASSFVSGGTTYYNSYQVYCAANGLAMSPWEDTQRAASAFIQDLLEMTNSDAFCSAGQLNIVPYGDAPITGNGVTYTPNLTPLFAFGDDDYMLDSKGALNDPVVMTRKSLPETFNVIRVEYLDRANAYNAGIAEWKDPQDIALNGIRPMATKTFHAITSATVAYQVASLIGQRQLYIRETYQFTVRADFYSLLEPMDLVTITDSNLGLVNKLVRIIETQDDRDDHFTITAEEMPVGTSSAPLYNLQDAQGYAANYAAIPPPVTTPVIFSVPPGLVGAAGGYLMGVAAGPATPTGTQEHVYGGCNVYASLDNATWTFMGTITGSSMFGTLTSSITSGATSLAVTVNAETFQEGYTLSSASSADFAANRALLWVDGEIMGFQTVTLVSGSAYTVTVSRGLFGTVAVSHASGAQWCRLSESMMQFPFDPGMIGQTMYFEFYAFNELGHQTATTPTTATYAVGNTGSGNLLAGPLKLSGTNVLINGNSVYATAIHAIFGTQQSYANGCAISFSTPNNTDQILVGLSLSANMFTSTGWAGFQTLGAGSPGTLQFSEGGVGGYSFTSGPLGTYVAGDVLSIQYDGSVIHYVQNGVILREVVVPKQLTFYGSGYLYNSFAIVQDITFGSSGAGAPVIFRARGNCIASDTSVAKVGGTSAWDSDAYSVNGYTNCNLSFKAAQTTGLIAAGFCSQPMTNFAGPNNYTGIPYGFYLNGSGVWTIYELGVSTGVTGSYDTTTLFSLTYDGTTLVYLINKVSVRTVSVSAIIVYSELCFYTPGAALTSLQFGPGTALPAIDTSQLGANAVTNVYTGFNAGPINETGAATVGSVSIPAQAHPYSLDIDARYTSTMSTTGGSVTDTCSYTTGGTTTSFNLMRSTLYAASGQPPVRTEVRQSISIPANQAVTIQVTVSAITGGITVAYTNLSLFATLRFA